MTKKNDVSGEAGDWEEFKRRMMSSLEDPESLVNAMGSGALSHIVKKGCDVRVRGTGEQCPGKARYILRSDAGEARLCPDCYDAVRRGSYGEEARSRELIWDLGGTEMPEHNNEPNGSRKRVRYVADDRLVVGLDGLRTAKLETHRYPGHNRWRVEVQYKGIATGADYDDESAARDLFERVVDALQAWRGD